MHSRRNQLDRQAVLSHLEWALQALALPARDQVSLFPDSAHPADELILDFDHWYLVSLSDLEKVADAGTVTPEVLANAGIIKSGEAVKVLANGTISKPVKVQVEKRSAKARQLIEEAGGEVLEVKTASE